MFSVKIATRVNLQQVTHCKKIEEMAFTDLDSTRRSEARRQLLPSAFRGHIGGNNDWHSCATNGATLCACSLSVVASHVATLTGLYENIRRSVPIFRISDFKDFKISS